MSINSLDVDFSVSPRTPFNHAVSCSNSLLELFLLVFVASVQRFLGHRCQLFASSFFGYCTTLKWLPLFILLDRGMLPLLLPLLMLVTARELVSTWSPADCCATRHNHADRTEVPKHPRHAMLNQALSSGHVNMSQCEPVFRNHCFAEWVGPQIGRVLLTDSAHSKLVDLTSSWIHKYATSMCFNPPIPCLWTMCSVAFALMANTVFISAARSFNDTFLFDSHAPKAAAYSSVAALFLAMIFLLARVCFHRDCRAVSRFRWMIFEFLFAVCPI